MFGDALRYLCGIPPARPLMQYPNPPDLGGLRANIPIVTMIQQHALFHEVVTDQWAPLLVVDNWPRYDGDVWTIQLTARPGYYVTPENMVAYAEAGHDVPWG